VLDACEGFDGEAWAIVGSLSIPRYGLAGAGISSSSALSVGGNDDANPIWPTVEEYHEYAEGERVTLIRPTREVTISIGFPAVITLVDHGFDIGVPILFSTIGVLPTGLIAGRTYYVESVIDSDTFTVTATKGGTPISTSGSQSGTHQCIAQIHYIYESLTAHNFGKYPLVSPDDWILAGVTNRWSMFDTQIISQTVNPDAIKLILQGSGYTDSVALLNVRATAVQVILRDSGGTIRYNNTVSLVDGSDRVRDVALLDLPIGLYNNPTIEINITESGATVGVGACVIGIQRDVGATQAGVNLGIQDYSVKKRDDFGNATILQRAYNKRGVFQTWVRNTDVDKTYNAVADLRAVPIVYVGSDLFRSSIIYGFFKDFSILISYPEYSVMSLEVEGLI
jgi:hypothetical protein